MSGTSGALARSIPHRSRRGVCLRRLLAWAVLWLALLGAGAPERAWAEEEAALERAAAFFEAGRLYPAEVAAREAVAQEPENAAAHRLLGRILLRRQRPEAAAEALSRAKALDPSLPGVDRELADALLLAGDDAGACAAYARVLTAGEDDARVHLRRAGCAVRLGDLEAAEAALLAAARDPQVEQIALYRLGQVRARAGKRDAAREAFERAAFVDPPSPLAARAWTELKALEQVERSWSLSAAAGVAFDDNVTRSEVDVTTNEPDQAAQLELAATWKPELPRMPSEVELQLGYSLLQTLYVDATELDLQSHGMSASLGRALGPGSASLSYLYSLNTLDGERFLDLQDLRPSYGLALRRSWYATFTPALQIKRFERSPDRDALAGSLGTLQLFDLSDGAWGRYLLFGLDGELEDTDGRQFDWRGLSTQAALHWSQVFGERVVPLDLRYRFRLRDYLHDTTLRAATADAPAITTARRDTIHSVRARTSWDLYRFGSPSVGVALDLEYEFEDATSDVPSADYSQNVVTLLLRFSL